MDVVRSMRRLRSSERARLGALGVKIVYLFGSHAEGMASIASDVDIGVVMTDPTTVVQNTNEIYLHLFELFSPYVECSDQLDIVFLQRAPLELRYDVITHGLPIYSRSEACRLDFEERTTIAYCDFQPLLRQFDRSIIENR